MIFARRLLGKRLTCRPPDCVDRREDKYLLIWRDVPFWTVVDGDFYEFLGELDGRRPVREIVRSRPEWDSLAHDVVRNLGKLLQHGIVRHEEKRTAVRERSDGKIVPIENLSVNVTRRCNLRCGFCYNVGTPTGPAAEELSSAEIASFLKKIRRLLAGKPTLALLGGEPLLYPDKVVAVARAARRLGFETILSTNGTLVRDDFARAAARAGLQVQVSLDGHNAQVNDMVRGEGAFERTTQGIRTLARCGAYTIVSMVCHRGNVGCLKEFYELASSLGVNEARFIPLKRMGGALEGAFQPVGTTELVRAAVTLFSEHPELLELAGRDCFSILATTCRYSMRRRSCGTGLQTFLLDADGSIYPCLNNNRPELRVGNVREPGFDFHSLWRESPVLEDVRRKTCIDTMNDACAACPVRCWCLGGCRGETYVNRGALDAKPWNCEDLRSALLEVMWTVAERPDLIKGVAVPCSV